jgi:Flp pilus assembly protein TadD
MAAQVLRSGFGPAGRNGSGRLWPLPWLLGLAALAAQAPRVEPPAPLVAGGRLEAAMADLARTEPLAADVWIEPALGPVEQEVEGGQPIPIPAFKPPLAIALPPRPPPPKPDFARAVASLSEPKPTSSGHQAPPPTIWPPPPKPPAPPRMTAPAASDLAIEPAGPPDGPVVVAHGAAHNPAVAAAVAVATPADQLRLLDRAGREALLAGDAAAALGIYERLSALFPDERTAMLGRALALEQLGRKDEARALYQIVLADDPDDLSARIALISLIAERAPGEALQLFRRLAPYHPRDARLPEQIGLILAAQNQLDGAIAELHRAAALDPANVRYQINLAVVQDRAGRTAAAIECYRAALRMAAESGAPTADLEGVAARLEHLSGQRGAPPPAPDRQEGQAGG